MLHYSREGSKGKLFKTGTVSTLKSYKCTEREGHMLKIYMRIFTADLSYNTIST